MEPKLKAQFDAVEAVYREGKFSEAEAAYLKAKELAPENALILERLGSIALWNNRAEEAERYYNAALRNRAWYQNFWPLNAQLQARLAMAYYRQDRFAQATPYFDKAAGPIALGPFQELKALGQHTALLANETAYSIEGPEQSRVDFVVTDPLPVVQVSVNGSEPLYFFIDTGGAEVILDKALAEQLGVKIAGAFSTPYAGGNKAKTGLGRVDSLQIGDYVIRNVPIHTLELADAVSRTFNGLEVTGAIGTRLLMHFLSNIDYADGALILQQASPENLQNLETQIAAGGKAIPFWLIYLHYIVAQGTVNNQGPMLFLVDTGLAGNGFTAPEPVLEAAGIKVDWTKAVEGPNIGGNVKGTGFVVERLTLGTGANEIVGQDIPGVAIENSAAAILGDQLGFRVGGLISHQFFRPYALTLDFTGMRLVVQ